jgi:hypothetical protein
MQIDTTFEVSFILKLTQFVNFDFSTCNTQIGGIVGILTSVGFCFRSSFLYQGVFCYDGWDYISGRGSRCPSRPHLAPLVSEKLIIKLSQGPRLIAMLPSPSSSYILLFADILNRCSFRRVRDFH